MKKIVIYTLISFIFSVFAAVVKIIKTIHCTILISRGIQEMERKTKTP